MLLLVFSISYVSQKTAVAGVAVSSESTSTPSRPALAEAEDSLRAYIESFGMDATDYEQLKVWVMQVTFLTLGAGLLRVMHKPEKKQSYVLARRYLARD